MTSDELRQAVLARQARRFADAAVGDLEFRLRSLNALEFTRVQAAFAAMQGKGPDATSEAMAQANALLIRLAVVGQDDLPVFSDADVEQIKQLDHAVFEQLAEAASRHCRLDDNGAAEKN